MTIADIQFSPLNGDPLHGRLIVKVEKECYLERVCLDLPNTVDRFVENTITRFPGLDVDDLRNKVNACIAAQAAKLGESEPSQPDRTFTVPDVEP